MKTVKGSRKYVDIHNRKWSPHKEQEKFEKLLEENGFIISGIKESTGKAEYMVTKDDAQEEFSFHVEDKAADKIAICLKSHAIYLENIKLKQELMRKER